MLAALALAGGASAQTGKEACEEIEVGVKATYEGTKVGPEQVASEATRAAATCWSELHDNEVDGAKVDQEIREGEEREAARKAEHAEERQAEKRERAEEVRRERHHICMEAPAETRCAVRPHSLIYGAHATIYGIHPLSWGPHRAVGIGHILWRHTVTEPHFGPYRAKLVLTEPGECGRGTWYSRRSLTIKRGDVLERNEPFGPCSAP